MALGDWPPHKGSQCNWPDLSQLSSRQTLGIMLQRLVGDGPQDPALAVLIMNLVRLTDKAVVDYCHARAAFEVYLKSDGMVQSPLLLAIGHTESCINAIVRAVRFGTACAAHPYGSPFANSILSDPRCKTILQIRNRIEHMDEDILQGKAPTLHPPMLILASHGLAAGGQTLSYSDFAAVLTGLHQLAASFLPP